MTKIQHTTEKYKNKNPENKNKIGRMIQVKLCRIRHNA